MCVEVEGHVGLDGRTLIAQLTTQPGTATEDGLSLPPSLPLSPSLSLSLSLSLSHSHTHTLTHYHSPTLTHSHSAVDYGPVGQRYLSFFPSTHPTTQCMTIPINDDFTVEQDETFNVNLHTSSDFTRVGLPVSTVTIINDDGQLYTTQTCSYYCI